MGWSGGSQLMSEVIETVLSNVGDEESRRRIYSYLIEAFEMEDADTLDECLGVDSIYDEVYYEKYPKEEEE